MPVNLNVLIIGAGLGGLSAAIALRKAGHSVTCLEGAKELSEIGAGLQVPPNATRLLAALGVFDAAQEVAVSPSFISMRRYSSGAVISSTPLNPTSSETYGYPYWHIHRAEYQKLLYKGAVDAGANIVLNARVVSVDVRTQQVSTVDGRVFQGDIIIGADGIRSCAQSAVVGQEVSSQDMGSHIVYRVTIPASKFLEDPATADLIRNPQCIGWAGHGSHIVTYPVRTQESVIYNIVAITSGEAHSWSEECTIDEMQHHFHHFDSYLKSNLLGKGKGEQCTKWALAKKTVIPTWCKGRVVLIGDAAHAMHPFLGQGAAQALEDAVTLGVLLSNLDETDDLSDRLELYEKVRRPRVERIQTGSSELGALWHLPDGPAQIARDSAMRTTGSMNPNPFSNPEFQPYLYSHDAISVAQEALEAFKQQPKKQSEGQDIPIFQGISMLTDLPKFTV